jgi:hypothetical protein
MIQVFAVLVGISGIALLLFGAGWTTLFVFARLGWDRFVQKQWAAQTSTKIGDYAEGIRNPILRRLVNKHSANAASAVVISMIRGEISSRIQIGFAIMAAGLAIFVASFFASSWAQSFIDMVILNKRS